MSEWAKLNDVPTVFIHKGGRSQSRFQLFHNSLHDITFHRHVVVVVQIVGSWFFGMKSESDKSRKAGAIDSDLLECGRGLQASKQGRSKHLNRFLRLCFAEKERFDEADLSYTA